MSVSAAIRSTQYFFGCGIIAITVTVVVIAVAARATVDIHIHIHIRSKISISTRIEIEAIVRPLRTIMRIAIVCMIANVMMMIKMSAMNRADPRSLRRKT